MQKLLCLVGLVCSFLMLKAQDLYQLTKVQELKIYFERPDWERALDSLKQNGQKERMTANIKVNGQSFSNAGVRFKGNSSYNSARNIYKRKLPLNIKIDYKNKTQAYRGGYTSLKLANGFRDPSMVREVLSYEIARTYMPAPEANFIQVYINDKHYGFYTNVESINENFIKKHYKNEDLTLIKCDIEPRVKKPSNCPKASERGTLQYIGKDTLCYANIYEVKEGDNGFQKVIRLTETLKNKPENIDKVLNVDQTLWMLAFNNVLVNLDSYTGRLAHNYYMVEDAYGRLTPIIWDLNLSFGGFRYADKNAPLSNEKMQELSPFTHYKNAGKPLISQVLANPRYRKTYIAHVQTILKDYFYNDKYYQRAKSIQTSIDYAMQKDENKFYSYPSFKQNIDASAKAGKENIIGIKELMGKRIQYLKNHPLLKKETPRIEKPQHTRKGSDKVTIKVRIQNAAKVFVSFRNKDFAPFKSQRLYDDGQHNDGAANDGVFGGEIDYAPKMQYYIYAENEKTAALFPERAEYEFLVVH